MPCLLDRELVEMALGTSIATQMLHRRQLRKSGPSPKRLRTSDKGSRFETQQLRTDRIQSSGLSVQQGYPKVSAGDVVTPQA